MQQRSGTERRRAIDRDAAQSLGRQPQGDGEEDLEPPRNPLSAREFEHPLRRAGDKGATACERRAGAAAGNKVEPMSTGDDPADAKRGPTASRTHTLEGGDTSEGE